MCIQLPHKVKGKFEFIKGKTLLTAQTCQLCLEPKIARWTVCSASANLLSNSLHAKGLRPFLLDLPTPAPDHLYTRKCLSFFPSLAGLGNGCITLVHIKLTAFLCLRTSVTSGVQLHPKVTILYKFAQDLRVSPIEFNETSKDTIIDLYSACWSLFPLLLHR